MTAPLANTPVIGYGTTIQKSGNASAYAMVTSISGLDIKSDNFETTALDSANGYKTFISGLKDAGEVTIQGHFNSAAHTSMFTDMNVVGSTATATYTITFNDKNPTGGVSGTQWSFSAFVTNYKTDFQVNGIVKFEVKLKVTGQPTLTIGS